MEVRPYAGRGLELQIMGSALRVNSSEGIGFQDPFQKGVRYKNSPDDVSFPLPKGPL